MSVTLLSSRSTRRPTAPVRLRFTSTSPITLVDLATGLLAEKAKHERDLRPATFAALVRDWCNDAPTPLHREALLAVALAGAPEPELLGAMLGCAPEATKELVRWTRALPIASPFDGALAGPVRSALLDLLAEEPTTLPGAAQRGADVLLARVTSGRAVESLRALADAVQLHRPGALGSALHVLEDDEVSAAEAFVRAAEGASAATRFRVARELDPEATLVRRVGERIVGLTYALRVDGAPAALHDADPALAAAALALRSLDARHAEAPSAGALLVRTIGAPSEAADDDVFAHAGAHLGAAQAPSVRWVLTATDGATIAPLVVDLHVLLGGPTSAREAASRLARIHYDALLAHAPRPVRTSDPRQLEPMLRSVLPLLRRPHRLAALPLVRRLSGGAAELRATIEQSTAALANEPGYVESARVLRATYFGAPQKQHAIAADLGLAFGTYRHHLRRAISDLAEELAARGLLSDPADAS